MRNHQDCILLWMLLRLEKGECEMLLNQQVKDIVKQVDWPCDVNTRFSDENQGCGFGPANAITWAFETCDRLIVLEDDCVPVPSFFTFCEEMLERYKDDERVNIISGRSHQQGSRFFDEQDYIFTHYAHTWGWATWKRVWNQFDIYMKDFPDWIKEGGAKNVLATVEQGKCSDNHLQKIYSTIEQEVRHSWDSQWVYTRLKTGLGIVPCKNLIQNIGQGNGTHTSFGFLDIPTGDMPATLRHPKFVVANYEYEELHFRTRIHLKTSIVNRILNRIKRQ